MVTLALLPTLPAAIALPGTPALDYLASIALVLHCHWWVNFKLKIHFVTVYNVVRGVEAMVTDYIHGPVAPKAASALLLLASVLTLGGLFHLNHNDVGFGSAVRKLWHAVWRRYSILCCNDVMCVYVHLYNRRISYNKVTLFGKSVYVLPCTIYVYVYSLY